LALSLILTFLLQPVVAMLHRWGLSHAPAAGLVVLLLALLIGAIGWVAVTQLSSLASELPRYQGNLKQKIEDLQHASQGGVFGKIQESVAELSRNFQKRQLPATGPQEPIAGTPPWSSLISYVPSFLGFLVDAGLVLVLLLFMLIAHRDLVIACSVLSAMAASRSPQKPLTKQDSALAVRYVCKQWSMARTGAPWVSDCSASESPMLSCGVCLLACCASSHISVQR